MRERLVRVARGEFRHSRGEYASMRGTQRSGLATCHSSPRSPRLRGEESRAKVRPHIPTIPRGRASDRGFRERHYSSPVASSADQSIILRTWDYSETSQTVSMLTRSHGMLRGIAKGSRRERSTFNGGFEPLTRGEIVFFLKPGAELATLAEWDLQEVYRGVRRAWRSHLAGLYLADLTCHALLDHDPHEKIFEGLDAALGALDEPGSIDLSIVRFQWMLLTETGYRPSLDPPAHAEVDRASRGWFSAASGGLVASDAPVHGERPWAVRATTIELLRRIGSSDRDVARATTSDVARRAARLMNAYFAHVLGQSIPTGRLVFPSDEEGSNT